VLIAKIVMIHVTLVKFFYTFVPLLDFSFSYFLLCIVDDGILRDSLLSIYLKVNSIYLYNLSFELYALIFICVGELRRCRYNRCILAKILFLYFVLSLRCKFPCSVFHVIQIH
jgi:hypothetical protein